MDDIAPLIENNTLCFPSALYLSNTENEVISSQKLQNYKMNKRTLTTLYSPS